MLATGALAALLYLGFAVIGLVLSLRLPANPIGWLYAASGLLWSLNVPGEAWVNDLVRRGRPLPLAALGSWLHAASLAAALICLVLRFRSSRGVERQQLRWVAAGATGAVVGLLVLQDTYGLQPGAWVGALVLALPWIPVTIAVAVLRYRLWDLDRLISRTVTYTLVTALLVIPYLLILPAATHLAGGAGSLAVAAATLAAAALFQPLRRRVQDRVDRRFNRRRYDTTRTLESFTARLREQVDLDALAAELLAVTDQTMQPARASLWLRPPTGPHPSR